MRLLPALLLACLVAAPAAAEGPSHRDNVVIVLDASGSMSGEMGGIDKMTAAKRAIEAVLRTVPETTQVGLLVFSSRRDADWVYPLGPRDDARLTAALAQVQPDGGTPLGAYIKKGADRLLEERDRQLGYGTYRLLVVTDGEASDMDLTRRYPPEVMARGIIVDVIGVKMKGDHSLATQVHSYRRADEPEALEEAIAEVLAEVGNGDAGVGDDSAFDLIAGLPDGLAAPVLDALTVSDNRPIGEGAVPTSVGHEAPRSSPRGSVGFRSLLFWIVIIVIVGSSILKRRFRR